ncbi:WD repeat-containing protein 74 [Euwallacea similis]|uniref:WD repeat-containing protein 74 n=1 Tax=Euwallacea similis TaxID=1736056 RepID=UPI00344BE601
MDISRSTFYVGTNRGALLCTTEKAGDFKVFKNLEDSSNVKALCEGRNQDELAVGYSSGNVYVFDIPKGAFAKAIDGLEGSEEVIGICCLADSLVIGKRDGMVNIWNKKRNDYFSLNLDEKGSFDAMGLNYSRNIIATGGENNVYKLWDIETKKLMFKAKSLGHDTLQLPIPTSIRGICLFNSFPHIGSCCTKEGHILLYDDRAQRKPVVKFEEPKASYTTIKSAFRDTQVMTGTTKGYMQWVDLKQPKILKTYTNFTGGVTDIVCDPLEPYVASISFDRHLRVNNMETKQLISKVYMKQNLSKLVVKPVVKNEDEQVEDHLEEVDQEYEDLFKNMEEVHDDRKGANRKRKIIRESTELTRPKAKRKVKKKGTNQ